MHPLVHARIIADPPHLIQSCFQTFGTPFSARRRARPAPRQFALVRARLSRVGFPVRSFAPSKAVASTSAPVVETHTHTHTMSVFLSLPPQLFPLPSLFPSTFFLTTSSPRLSPHSPAPDSHRLQLGLTLSLSLTLSSGAPTKDFFPGGPFDAHHRQRTRLEQEAGPSTGPKARNDGRIMCPARKPLRAKLLFFQPSHNDRPPYVLLSPDANHGLHSQDQQSSTATRRLVA